MWEAWLEEVDEKAFLAQGPEVLSVVSSSAATFLGKGVLLTP